MYASVLVEYTNKAVDKTFTYEVPDRLIDKVKVGMKVIVPFNKRNINGFVIELGVKKPLEYEIKEIKEIVDENLVLNEELMALGKYLTSKTLCSQIVAYQTMLPSSLKIKDKKHDYNKYQVYITLQRSREDVKDYIDKHKRSKVQVKILGDLLENEKVLKNNYARESVKTLLDCNLIKEIKEQVYRLSGEKEVSRENIKLTLEQERAIKEVDLNREDVYLLYGVTGSGKTEVYMQLMDKVIKMGKTALMLVPEITLTTQMISRLYARFGSEVAIFHSGLSDGEKYDEYLKIYRGEVNIVVGTRSAIFTPLNNLGIIILDEEHSETFKQDSNPRYHALDMAVFRGKYNNIPVVLGSATPSLETMARALKGVYKLIEMPYRIGKAVLPYVSLVDMTKEVRKKNSVISASLDAKIKERLNKKEQIILLLNRRGFSTIVTCQSCGYTYKCPYCDITLTYHKTTNNLRCHYCGYTKIKDKVCPECHEEALNYLGLGTERLEVSLQEKYPQARIVRMDVDTTANKGAHAKIINDFKEHKYDILLGTQMISKGLDFPNVTLVGVINADSSLNIPDFRSGERTFQLLNQTAGRAGRSDKVGEVIIQTFNPDNNYLNYVVENSYMNFYKYEMHFRKQLKYPPYYFLVSILIKSREYEVASSEAVKVVNYLKSNLDKETLVYGPTTAAVFKLNNIYRFQIMIKYRFDSKLMGVLKYLDEVYAVNSKVSYEVDINPNRM